MVDVLMVGGVSCFGNKGEHWDCGWSIVRSGNGEDNGSGFGSVISLGGRPCIGLHRRSSLVFNNIFERSGFCVMM